MAWQYSLRALLVAVAIVAGYCALYVTWRPAFWFLGVPLGLGGLTYLAKRLGAKVGTAEAVVVGVIVLVLVAPLIPAVESPGLPSRRAACSNNLKVIGLALQNYHDMHGCFPPAYVTDAQRSPLVSWRVLLLPHIGHRDLYDQWKQHPDEPWNGPNNIKLSKAVPEWLHCPSDTGPATDTSYVAVVGPGTAWPRTVPTSLSQISDGTSKTVIVVEVANSGINWMEPRDLGSANRAPGINSTTGMGVRSSHPHHACVLYADGSTRALEQTISDEQLRALFTIAGGEKVVLP
jgi:hypothetical protein